MLRARHDGSALFVARISGHSSVLQPDGVAMTGVGRPQQQRCQMTNPIIHAFYTSKAWIRCRRGYAKSKRGLCERCLAKGLHVPGTEVHHKIRLTVDNVNDPAVALSWSNLELLCKDCHLAEHDEGVDHRYTVTDSGQLII